MSAPGPGARLVLLLIRFYQWFISPQLGGNCRFNPTCSAYAMTAVRRHGAIRGSWLAFRRVLRCHPFSRGGHDPVPDSHDHRKCK